MKKISKELGFIFLILFITFILGHIIYFYFIYDYIKKETIQDIYDMKEFINAEKREIETEELTILEFIEDVFEDNPQGSNIEIIFSYNGKKYFKTKNNEINYKELDKVKKISENYVMNFKLEIKEYNEILQVQVIRNFQNEMKFIKKLIKTAFYWFSIILILIFIILFQFYNKINFQAKKIEGMTNDIDIKNFNKNFNEKNFYYEFSNILISYNKMIERIKKQTENEIDFVNNASHELKTPIFIIAGYLDVIDTIGRKDEKIFNESINVIKTEIKEMKVLIEKLMFIAKKDKNNLKIEKINLNNLLIEVCEEIKIIHFESLCIISGIDFDIESDRKLLKQMIRNIVENSIKYSGKNKVEIIMLKETYKLIIKDYGIGIQEEELQKIFDRFYRVDTSRNKKKSGHGLGLNIVKTISDILDITIELESRPEKETSFILTFKKGMVK